jgi:hypothetical protein
VVKSARRKAESGEPKKTQYEEIFTEIKIRYERGEPQTVSYVSKIKQARNNHAGKKEFLIALGRTTEEFLVKLIAEWCKRRPWEPF